MLGWDKAVNAEDHTAICDGEEPAYWRYKARYAYRERGTKNISIFKGCNSYKITTTNLTKVTRSLYIVTNLGQLPFMLFT